MDPTAVRKGSILIIPEIKSDSLTFPILSRTWTIPRNSWKKVWELWQGIERKSCHVKLEAKKIPPSGKYLKLLKSREKSHWKSGGPTTTSTLEGTHYTMYAWLQRVRWSRWNSSGWSPQLRPGSIISWLVEMLMPWENSSMYERQQQETDLNCQFSNCPTSIISYRHIFLQLISILHHWVRQKKELQYNVKLYGKRKAQYQLFGCNIKELRQAGTQMYRTHLEKMTKLSHPKTWMFNNGTHNIKWIWDFVFFQHTLARSPRRAWALCRMSEISSTQQCRRMSFKLLSPTCMHQKIWSLIEYKTFSLWKANRNVPGFWKWNRKVQELIWWTKDQQYLH